MTEGTKVCGRCRRALPVDAFARHSRDGLQGRCRGCKREATREWRATERGRELSREAVRRSRARKREAEGSRPHASARSTS